MVEINSSDYHDFVIKRGTLIGEFDQMYKKSSQVPWHQDEQENWIDIRLTIEILRGYGPFDFICDFGCGLGYFIDIIYNKLGTSKCTRIGYDISKNCCSLPKGLFPEVDFRRLNLMDPHINSDICVFSDYNKKIFTMRATLWYVCPSLPNVISNLSQIIKTNELLLISQNFPPLNSNFFGRDIISSPESLINHFKPNFTPIKWLWLEDHILRSNDNWFIALLKRTD